MAVSMAGAISTFYGCSLSESVLVCFVALISSTLPDRMEYIGLGLRWVSHRTLTHWVIPWVVILCLPFFLSDFLGRIGVVVMLGIGVGGVGHLLGDFFTPMGVPLLLPLRKFSISYPIGRLWYQEAFIVILFLLAFNFYTGLKWLDFSFYW